MKTCSKCNTEKPDSEFSFDANNRDRLRGSCKECTNSYYAAYRNKNIERIRAADRKRIALPSRKKALKARGKTPDGKISIAKAGAKYRKANPIKCKTRESVKNALKDGKITRPDICSCCSKPARLDGHHDDYSKPLDVRWLCRICHNQWHRENGEGLNG